MFGLLVLLDLEQQRSSFACRGGSFIACYIQVIFVYLFCGICRLLGETIKARNERVYDAVEFTRKAGGLFLFAFVVFFVFSKVERFTCCWFVFVKVSFI